MSLGLIIALTYILIFLALRHFIRFNDEFLFLPVMFFYATGLQRYEAVTSGNTHWVRVAYSYNIFTPMTDEKAMTALGLFMTGTIIFILSYIYYNKKLPYPNLFKDNNELLSEFVKEKKQFILIGFIVFLGINTLFRGLISGPMALGNSYFLLFGMGVASFILLGFLAYRNEYGNKKTMYLLMIIYGMYISYNPAQRFQFLSWMVAIGIIAFQGYTPVKKLKFYVAGGIFVLLFFALAGVARTHNLSQMSLSEMYEAAKERNETREDQNMLDGFMMILDVYPEHLNYSYGMEHLEILMRPIPRQLWPGKPLGGYANKLGLSDVTKGTVGISQTIYGTFYGEGGFWGIVLLSILYGWIFVKLFRYTYNYNSDLQWLLKGIIIASFVPILRGGDLPGIIAFIGMSYWPVVLFVYQYNKFLKRKEVEALGN